jgi:cytoskeletal protein CcmA (bactofilin family)
MFGKLTGNSRGKAVAHTLLSEATEVLGDIRFSGELIIEGKLTGSISAADGSDAVLRISEQGEVDGSISVPIVVINGLVTGDVHASKHIELAAKARVKGNVFYRVIEMVMGAQINGSLICDPKMSNGIRALAFTGDPRSESYAITDTRQGNS